MKEWLMPYQLSWCLYLSICDCTLLQCSAKFLNHSNTLRTNRHAKFCEWKQLHQQAQSNFQCNRMFGTGLIPIPVEWSLFNYNIIQKLRCCVPLLTVRFWDQVFFFQDTTTNTAYLDRLPLHSQEHVDPSNIERSDAFCQCYSLAAVWNITRTKDRL
jgi:hypothetical protein